MRHPAERIDFALSFFLAQPDADQHRAQRRESERVQPEPGRPIGGETAAGPEDGLRMLGTPPLDGEDDDGDVDEGEDVEDGGEGGALRGLFDGAPQHEVAGVKEPADQGAGESRVPGPPDASDDTAPEGSGDQVGGEEGESDFGDGDGESVPEEVPVDEEKNAGGEGDERTGEGDHGHGGVEEDDLENGALVGFRREAGDDVDIARQKEDRENAECE